MIDICSRKIGVANNSMVQAMDVTIELCDKLKGL